MSFSGGALKPILCENVTTADGINCDLGECETAVEQMRKGGNAVERR